MTSDNRVAAICAGLSKPARVTIYKAILETEEISGLTIREIHEAVEGQINLTLNAVYHHVTSLCRAGLVRANKTSIGVVLYTASYEDFHARVLYVQTQLFPGTIQPT